MIFSDRGIAHFQIENFDDDSNFDLSDMSDMSDVEIE
jgi:hypothetical protein